MSLLETPEGRKALDRLVGAIVRPEDLDLLEVIENGRSIYDEKIRIVRKGSFWVMSEDADRF